MNEKFSIHRKANTKAPNEVKDKSETDIPGGQFSNYTGKDAVH